MEDSKQPFTKIRRSIRLKNYNYSLSGAYFVTVCTLKRTCLFGNISDNCMAPNELGTVASSYWHSIPTYFPNVILDAFIVMPNHVHGILLLSMSEPTISAINCAPTLGNIVRAYKARTTVAIKQLGNSSELIVWQRNYYERVVRNEAELNNIRQYITDNPRNWKSDSEYPSGCNETVKIEGVINHARTKS